MKDGKRKSRGRCSEDASIPDMQGLSLRNLKYMRAFAAGWPDREIVQEVLAQITCFHNCVLLDISYQVKDLNAGAVLLAATIKGSFTELGV